MSPQTPDAPGTLYRVDKFAVPTAALAEFLAATKAVHETLRRQPGFRYDLVLQQQDGPGTFNVVTVAAWENADAVTRARAVVAKEYESRGFDPAELIARLGVTADFGTYTDVRVPLPAEV